MHADPKPTFRPLTWSSHIVLLACTGCSSNGDPPTSGLDLATGKLEGSVVFDAVRTDSTGTPLDTISVSGVAGTRVYLASGATVLDSTQTVGGAYEFSGLKNGTYAVFVRLGNGAEWGEAGVVGSLTLPVSPIVVRPIGNLTLKPNPFGRTIAIGYELTAPASPGGEVLGLDGRVVKSFPPVPLAPGSHQIDWDGRDSAGRPLPLGPYCVHLHGSGMDDRLAVLEKVAAPPRPGTIVGTVELEGVATDAAGVVQGPIVVDDVSGIRIEVSGNGVLDSTWTTDGHYRFDGLEPGNYQLKATLDPRTSKAVGVGLDGDSVTAPVLRFVSAPTLSARPNPFTTSVTVSINLVSQTLIGASLQSATGRDIKVLRYGDLYGPGTFSAGWNGLDELNQPAPPGPYWIVMGSLFGSSRTLVVLERP